MSNIPAPGYYRHFKGREYEVLDVVKHSETTETMVLYRALYGDFGLWVRPLESFVSEVEVEGESRPRFALISKP